MDELGLHVVSFPANNDTLRTLSMIVDRILDCLNLSSSDSGNMYNVAHAHLPGTGIDVHHLVNEVRSRWQWRAKIPLCDCIFRQSRIDYRSDVACDARSQVAPSSSLVAPFTATLPGDVLSLDPQIMSTAQQGKLCSLLKPVGGLTFCHAC